MKRIINRSGHVITVSNRYFTKEVPIDAELTVSEEEIQNDYGFTLEFFSQKHMKKENKIELKRGIDNIAGIWVDMHSAIPMKTAVDFKDGSEAVVTEKDIEFHFLTLPFKRISLRKPHVEGCSSKEKTEFASDKDRRYFKRWLLLELLVTFFLIPLLIYASYASFSLAWGLFEQISLPLITIALLNSYLRKLVYLLRHFKARGLS